MMIKAKSLEPESLYDFELFYWNPELLGLVHDINVQPVKIPKLGRIQSHL